MTRGRKRQHDYAEGSRNAASRAALRQLGGAIVSVSLQPDAKAALDVLVNATGETKAAIINRLILQAGAESA